MLINRILLSGRHRLVNFKFFIFFVLSIIHPTSSSIFFNLFAHYYEKYLRLSLGMDSYATSFESPIRTLFNGLLEGIDNEVIYCFIFTLFIVETNNNN